MNPSRDWLLTDVEQRIWLDRIDIGPDDVPGCGGGGWHISKQTLKGGLSDNVDVIEVSNGPLSFQVVPTRGMGLLRGAYKGYEIGWSSPVKGPVHPFFINSLERGGLGWLRGFDECIVRCGLNFNGAPVKDIVPDNNGNPSEIDLTLHGHIANTPAHRVSVAVTPGTPDLLTVTGSVDEAMLFGPRLRLTTAMSTAAGANCVTIRDEVTNLGDTAAELSLLYHCNFGPPFLEGGAEIVAPSVEVAPRDTRAQEDIAAYKSYLPPTPGYVEQVYWHDMACTDDGYTLAALKNNAGDKAIIVRYNKKQLPAFAQWKNTAGTNDGYVTGLEPGVNFPNPRPFERERGRIPTLQPGETYVAELVLEIQDTASGVQAIETEVAKLTGMRAPVVHQTPISKWSQ